MMRSLYRSVLLLHPPDFRRQFAGEMLWIFDEASASEGAIKLLGDGVLSLIRQWMLGSGAWKLVAGALLAIMQLLFLSGLAHIERAGAATPHPLPASLHSGDIVFSQGLLLVFVLLALLVTFLRMNHARTTSRH
jgi:hypothetical protein